MIPLANNTGRVRHGLSVVDTKLLGNVPSLLFRGAMFVLYVAFAVVDL